MTNLIPKTVFSQILNVRAVDLHDNVVTKANICVNESIIVGFRETVTSSNTEMRVDILHPEYEIEIEIE